MSRRIQAVVAMLSLFVLTSSGAAALPPPSPSPPVFQERPFGPKPAPTPPRPSVVRTRTPEPLPWAWVLGGAAFAGLASAAILLFGIRSWRMSRLFGRQHLFPVRNDVALRLGGERSGGLMATARFGDTARPMQAESEAKQS